MKSLIIKILNTTFCFNTLQLFFGVILVLFSLTSCKDDEIITVPVESYSNNLVIITDNDPASYEMIKITGKINSSFPGIQITYLQSKQFDIYEGAFLLSTALNSFPEGTVIAGLVEPGADSKRLVYQIGSKRVFVPDNGLSTWILHDYPRTTSYFVENSSVLEGARPADLSYEDFYAYSICSLISGVPTANFGSLCPHAVTFPVQEARIDGNIIMGQVLFTDNFGNCITNIPKSIISNLPEGTVFTLSSGSVQTQIKLGSTYSSVSTGENVCFFNSSRFFVLATNYGNFSEKYHISSGAVIQLTK